MIFGLVRSKRRSSRPRLASILTTALISAKKPTASTNKNSATATVSGLKPGQKVKVTVNVRPR